MKDFVSNRRGGVVRLASSLSVIWLVFIIYGLPWTGLLSVSLAFVATLWVARDSNRSIANVIDDIEGDPVPAIAARVANTPLMKRRHAR